MESLVAELTHPRRSRELAAQKLKVLRQSSPRRQRFARCDYITGTAPHIGLYRVKAGLRQSIYGQ
jgi:hypothetical protein